MDFWNVVFFENTLQNWLTALLIFTLTWLGLVLARQLMAWRMGKLQTVANGIPAGLVRRTKMVFLLVVAVYLGSLALILPPQAGQVIRTVMIVAGLLQVGIWGVGLINLLVRRRIAAEREQAPTSETTLNALGLVGKIVLWSVISLLILENITGIQVNALIASLGIGGIAVALAVQNILGDLFASLTIALDKPFVIGDAISVGDYSGTIEHIGLKSTRLRSLSGEQLVFSNSDLLSSRIRNYKRMERRRAVFIIGVTYQTPAARLAAIPEILRQIISDQANVTFERSHLKEFGDFAIIFESVYFVESPELPVFMDVQQAINLAIFTRFEQEGIEFAYPTQTVFVQGGQEIQENPPHR